MILSALRVTCAQNLEEKITEAISQVVREKAPDAVARVAQILQAKTGKMPCPPTVDYIQTVGNTPMVNLKKILPADCKAKRVLAKLEMQNPGGSLKDRIALSMIEAAEARKEITPGTTTLVDFTSGNTGSESHTRSDSLTPSPAPLSLG